MGDLEVRARREPGVKRDANGEFIAREWRRRSKNREEEEEIGQGTPNFGKPR
jgi:hypothetical protein